MHDLIHNTPTRVRILRQMSQLHAIPPSFFYSHFNVKFLSTLRSSKQSLSFGLPHQKCACIFLLPYICPTHLALLCPNNVWSRERTKKLLIIQFFSSPLLLFATQVHIPYSQQPAPCSLTASDHVLILV